MDKPRFDGGMKGRRAGQIAAVREETEAGTLEKARCVGYLAGIALKAIDAGDMAARVEALEAVLKRRKQGNGKA